MKLTKLMRAFTWVMCLLLVEATLCADAPALQAPAVAPTRPGRISQLVTKLGSGPDALVVARLRDRSIVSGYIAASGPSSFSIADRETGALRTIDYAQVDRLAGYNLMTGTEVDQDGGIRAKLARAVAFILPARRVPANNLSGGSKVLLIGIVLGVLIAIIVAKVV